MPIPPLDGSHIFTTIFPSLDRGAANMAGNPIFVIGIVFLMIFIIIPYILEPLFRLITGTPLMFF